MILPRPSVSRGRCRWPAALLLLAFAMPATSCGQAPPKPMEPPVSLSDPRLEMIRMASASWELKSGPTRKVVDQVCLVPDLATFFEAIATWDDAHYFPILIDDVESTLRFLRTFRPAKIVRFPKAATPIAEGTTWDRALAAVAASWSSVDDPTSLGLTGDSVPTRLGATPPGVVFSHPSAPMLAGAVALAAGRFQPLLRLETRERYTDKLTLEEFRKFDRQVTLRVLDRIPNCDRLADGCDFLTVAGDYPYRYQGKDSEDSVDDGIGRLPGPGMRWAYAGRLLGDPAQSVYRAMCSLFLQPQTAIMFNGYPLEEKPWSDYSMRLAATRMSSLLPTAHLSGKEMGSVAGWHEIFQAGNRSGLVLINSAGMSTQFNLLASQAGTPDVPRSVPAAVFNIHSFSAQNPNDPGTVAGRWLANGAFVYFGSMNEPFLNAFRAPILVGELIGERLPMVVAARATLLEPFGTPWRLVYLGDPLYKLKPRGTTPPRVPTWEPTAAWPSYSETPRPADGDDGAKLRWALKATLARLQGTALNPTDDLADALLEIPRAKLPADLRQVYDALLADLLFVSMRKGELRSRIASIPPAERTPDLRRYYDTILAADFQYAISKKDFARARALWTEILRIDSSHDWRKIVTDRVGKIADTTVRMGDWSNYLRAAIRVQPRDAADPYLEVELKRVLEAMKPPRK